MQVSNGMEDITNEQWIDAFTDKDLVLSDSLDEMVTYFDSGLKLITDKLAPEKKIKIPLRPKQPWYTSELRTLKSKVRKLEKKWLKYKLDCLCVAWKKARNSYYVHLNNSKKGTLRLKILDCHDDSKKLHKLVNNLTSKTVENPLPPGLSDEQQANSFADYFENKILTIRQLFIDKPEYHLTPKEVPG